MPNDDKTTGTVFSGRTREAVERTMLRIAQNEATPIIIISTQDDGDFTPLTQSYALRASSDKSMK